MANPPNDCSMCRTKPAVVVAYKRTIAPVDVCEDCRDELQRRYDEPKQLLEAALREVRDLVRSVRKAPHLVLDEQWTADADRLGCGW